MLFEQACATLRFEATHAARRGRARRFAGPGDSLLCLQALRQAFEGDLAIGTLRSSLSGCYSYSTWAMNESYACFNFIAVLPAGFVEQTPSVQIILPNWLQMSCGKRLSLTLVVGWREREPQILSWGIRCQPRYV